MPYLFPLNAPTSKMSFWISRSFDLGNLGVLRMGPVNVFKNYIFEISAFKGKNEACHSFLENIFTKSVHRGGVRGGWVVQKMSPSHQFR